ncbi:MAG: hypothetical protein FIB07_08295 [Candidatus Methanoperedens sp.]|nr:hypothetical protein [Candidatus Methanoperedens sp.]
MNKIIVMLLLFTVVALSEVPEASARSEYLTNFSAVYGDGSCAICHVNPAGGGTLTAYGSRFAAQPNYTANVSAALIATGRPTIQVQIITPEEGSTVNGAVDTAEMQVMNGCQIANINEWRYRSNNSMIWNPIANSTNPANNWSVTWNTTQVDNGNYVIGGNMSNTSNGTPCAPGNDTVNVTVNNSNVTISPANETVTRGGVQEGVRVRERFVIKQGQFPEGATDLHFKLWQKEDNIDINGWEVKIIGAFPNSNSNFGDQPEPAHSHLDNMPGLPNTNNPDNGKHAVDVNADGANIPPGTRVEIEATFWLTSWNTKRIADVVWTRGNPPDRGNRSVPDHGWTVDNPVQNPANPGQYNHSLCLINDDATKNLNITELAFNATMDFYQNLTDVIFSPSNYSFNLTSGEQNCTNVTTSSPLLGGHIYFKYNISDSNISYVDTADHPIPNVTATVVQIIDNMSGVPQTNQSTMDILSENFMNFNAGDRYNITVTNVSRSVVEYNASGVLMGGPKQTIKVDWIPRTQGAYILRSEANTTSDAMIVEVINQKVIRPVLNFSQ